LIALRNELEPRRVLTEQGGVTEPRVSGCTNVLDVREVAENLGLQLTEPVVQEYETCFVEEGTLYT